MTLLVKEKATVSGNTELDLVTITPTDQDQFLRLVNYGESLGASSTSSSTLQEKLRVDATITNAKYCLIHYTCEIASGGNEGIDLEFEYTLDIGTPSWVDSQVMHYEPYYASEYMAFTGWQILAVGASEDLGGRIMYADQSVSSVAWIKYAKVSIYVIEPNP